MSPDFTAVDNAHAFLAVQHEFCSFDRYGKQFVGSKTSANRWPRMSQVPASTKVLSTMSKDLKKRGFRFIGGTICQAFMQAADMVNDHLAMCFRSRRVRL